VTAEAGYLLDNAAPEAASRFDALAVLLDDVTTGHLEGLGVGPGWRCLDVGAGGGSVAEWLRDRIRPGGSLVATDIDTRYLERLAAPDVVILRHDIIADPLPEAAFDLVHARCVLVHLADRVAAIQAMVRALRPGGWLLIEEFASGLARGATLESGPDGDVAERIRHGIERLIERRGDETSMGRALPARLRSTGLEDVGAAGFVVVDGGEAMARLERANVVQVAADLESAGVATASEITEHLARVETGAITPVLPPLVSCWGRRPAGGGDVDGLLTY